MALRRYNNDTERAVKKTLRYRFEQLHWGWTAGVREGFLVSKRQLTNLNKNYS